VSRGHGRVERAILEALQIKRRKPEQQGMWCMGASAKNLAHYVKSGTRMWSTRDPFPNYEPTRADIESVRRALRNLRRQDRVLPPIKHRHVIYIGPGWRPRSD
jgi:hypothetical protein